MADQPVSVLVVDDHDDFRALICEVVLATPGLTLAGQWIVTRYAINLSD